MPECGLCARPLHSSSCLVLPTRWRREATIKFGPDKSSYKLKMDCYPTMPTVRLASCSESSLCNLCVLCVSVVDGFRTKTHHRDTEVAQRRALSTIQLSVRLHNEERGY